MKGLPGLEISERRERDREKGVYILLIRMDSSRRIKIGKLGDFSFKAGFYVYTGRAKRNIEARIKRHRKKDKKLRWHIDYLLKERDSHLIGYIKYHHQEECKVNQRIKELEGAEILVKGFGASDCRNGCISHLLYFKYNPELELARWEGYY